MFKANYKITNDIELGYPKMKLNKYSRVYYDNGVVYKCMGINNTVIVECHLNDNDFISFAYSTEPLDRETKNLKTLCDVNNYVKPKRGRTANTTNYEDDVKPKLKDIEKMHLDGLSIPNISKVLGISQNTLYAYGKKYTELKNIFRLVVQ